MSIAVKRALELLNLFREETPAVGLSDAARRSGQDKATVYRHLNELRDAGLIEQDAQSRLYRLGPAVLHLARLREASFPTVSLVQPAMDRLSEVTGETSHCSLLTNTTLFLIAACESKKATRVSMQGVGALSFRTTAAGLAFLAFARPDMTAQVLEQAKTTPGSSGEPGETLFTAALAEARACGHAKIERTYDEEVFAIAAPLFGPDQYAVGAVAVTAPRYRMTKEVVDLIVESVTEAAVRLTREMGSEPPARYLALLEAGRVKARSGRA